MKKVFQPRLVMAPVPEEQGGGGGNSAENALIEKIKANVAEQVRSINGSQEQRDAVEKIFTENILANLTADQVRSFEEKSTLKTSLEGLMAKVTKLEQRQANLKNLTLAGFDTAVLKRAIESKFEDIEKVLQARNVAVEFTMTATRAAEVMTTENVMDLTQVDKEALDDFSVTNFVEKRRPYSFIFDIADRTTVQNIEKNKVWMSEGDEEGAFAIVAEGGLKPLVSVSLVKNSTEAKKVAGRSVYTDEVAKFKNEYYRIIRRLINDKLLRDFRKMLTTELMAAAAVYVSSALDGQFDNPTDYHAIAAVAAQIEALDFIPDVLVLNPQDKWRIGMSQDNVGAFYLAIPAASPDNQPTLLGFNVITSNEMPVGEFMLGESGLWKVEDETVTIKIGYGIEQIKNEQGLVTDVQADLDHNRFRVISELWYHSWIDSAHEGSFVKGNFAAIKEALTKAEPEA